MKKFYNSLFIKINKKQKYLILLNLFIIGIIFFFNIYPELIFFKIEFQDSLGDFWNNFFSTIVLIFIPYCILYIGLDFWDYKNESVSIINFSPFAIFYGFLYLEDTLEGFFKIHILIIVFTTMFLSFILIFLLLKITKTGRFYEKSKKIEVNDLQFQIFIFKNSWVKHYVFTYKKINTLEKFDEIPIDKITYFFILSENEYKDLKNEIGLFNNEIIKIKSLQYIHNFFHYPINHISQIHDSIERVSKFNNEIRNFNIDLYNLKMKFGMYNDMVLRCISFKSEITNNRKIIRFKINDRCKDCLNDENCINNDFFELEYDNFISILL